jgi:hypothetical protein
VEFFNDLGTRIAKSWSHSRYEFDALPDIATTELDRAPVHHAVDWRSLLHWVVSTDTLPPQINLDATFGEPPLTVFWHPHFYIEALYWCTSTTAVHGHGFVGAFQVLAGTSLQSLFTFESATPSGQRCRIGQLRQTDAKLLRPGTTQQILGGEDFVHSVFHLGYPSVTIVVRTFGAPPARLQYGYYRPGVAIPNDLSFDPFTRRLLQIAKLQATLQSDELQTTVATIAEKCDLSAAFTLLKGMQPLLFQQNRAEEATKTVLTLGSKHGLSVISKLAEALTVEGSLDPLRRAREAVTEDDVRLFLGLLLTQQSQRFVLAQVAEYTGDANPHEKIAGWIRELANQGVLKIPADERAEQFLRRWLEAGHPTARQGDGWNDGDVAQLVAQMKGEPLLAPLLFEPAA